jgi:hypothetical protein
MLISKLVLFIKLTFLFIILSFNTSANEVGNKLFVVKPIAKPIYTTKSGTKIYPCNGFINKKLIPIIYNVIRLKTQKNPKNRSL